jgi:PAS domain-containing protein
MTAERHGSDAVVVAVAPSGRIVFSNREASQVENRRLAELAGEFAILHPDGRPYLAGLIDHAGDAIVALDRDWFVTVWSKGAERMYGWTEEEVIGRHTTDVADLEMSDEARAESRRAVAEHGRAT